MPIAPNFKSIYTQNWEINFMQCAPNGLLRYTDLCNMLQLTASAHSESGGFSFLDMQAYDQAWVLSRMRMEIEQLPKWKDEVSVKTWINSLENSRSTRSLEVFVNGKKYIGVETFWAVFNTVSRRPEKLELQHEHCEKYPDKRGTTLPFSKIETKTDRTLLNERTVQFSDLDIVNHVNNVKYLEWCLDLANDRRISDNQIACMEMNFHKELSLNDMVKVHQQVEKMYTIFTVTKADKEVFALQLDWKK